jgi:hypothetical protein
MRNFKPPFNVEDASRDLIHRNKGNERRNPFLSQGILMFICGLLSGDHFFFIGICQFIAIKS